MEEQRHQTTSLQSPIITLTYFPYEGIFCSSQMPHIKDFKATCVGEFMVRIVINALGHGLTV